MSLSALPPHMIQAGALASVSLALFIGSFVSLGLFNSKGCTDSTANGNFQKCNGVNITISVGLFALAVAIYLEKIEIDEKQLVMLTGVVSLVLFITAMIQYSALVNNVACDATTLATLKQWNMVIWVCAIISLSLSSYMYYKIYTDEQKLLQFKFYLRK